MSLKWRVVLLALLFILPAMAEDNRRDGNWWREQTKSDKAIYMVGFFDGMPMGKYFSVWGLPKKDGKADSSAILAIVTSYDHYLTKYMEHVTNLQVSDGLDSFYADYRNQAIQVHNAVWLVLNTISGKSESDMKTIVESFRKNAR